MKAKIKNVIFLAIIFSFFSHSISAAPAYNAVEGMIIGHQGIDLETRVDRRLIISPNRLGDDVGNNNDRTLDLLSDRWNDREVTLLNREREDFDNNAAKRDLLAQQTCPDCVIVEPVAGLNNAKIIFPDGLPERLENILSNINNKKPEAAISKIINCSETVKSMRMSYSVDAGVYSTKNDMVRGFRKVCFSDNASIKKLMPICRENYNSYVSNCISSIPESSDKRVFDRVGILFASRGKYKGSPVCTATVISSKLLITARHCYLMKEDEQQDDLNANDYLVFVPSANLLNLSQQYGGAYIGRIEGELTIDGMKDIQPLNVRPNLIDDVIVLSLANPLTLETPLLSLRFSKEVSPGEQITILGYQEMATRKDDLYSTSFYLPEEKNAQYYLQNIMMDNSVTCYTGVILSGGFSHYCQSLYGASGSPIFIGDIGDHKNTDNGIIIAGIQSGGNESPAKELEKQGAPNSAALVSDWIIEMLINKGVIEK